MHVVLRSIIAAISLVFVSLLLANCSASTEILALDNAEASNDVATTTADDPPAELSSEEVYKTIENSVVFVYSPGDQTSGSGIVIDGGWILTNAHVVDRLESVRIGRSDGEDLGMHPVHAIDWVFDLALVGPIDDSALVPIQPGVSAELDLGSRVLLIGFPDEDARAPTPTLTEGIVSRRRFVALGDYPFLQVDATIAPGQSGGALVNGRGELVGISGLEFGQGEFGLVFASDPMWPRVDDLLLGGPGLPSGLAESELGGAVGPLTNLGFLLEVDESGSVDLEATSDDDIWIDLQSLGGVTINQSEVAADPFRGLATEGQLFVDERSDGTESLFAEVPPGKYQVLVGSFAEQEGTVRVSSSNELRPFVDAEELQPLPLNQIVEGLFDWSRDTDEWLVELEVGQTLSVRSDGISDTLLVIRFDDVVIAMSDDEGIGLFGTGSELEFVAETAGTYSIEVGSFDNDRWGYLIEASVTDAP